MKNKYVAATLAFVFGIFGTHRFYLGQRFLGIVYFFLFFIGMIVTMEEGGEFPLIILPAVLGFIDTILLAVMPQEDFDERYNKKRLTRRENYAPPRRENRPQQQALPKPIETNRETLSELKRRGIEKFRDFDFHGAIREFQKVLEISPNDPATLFNMACCYSILEEKEAAFDHLSRSVEFGFNNFEKIQNHDALAFLRTQPEYDILVKNGYKLPKRETPPTPVATKESEAPREEPLVLRDDLLDQIIQLGELRNKGILTEAEFARQKEKILAQR